MHTAKANSITIEPPPLTGGTESVYYFHSDHLGSASWITDGSGLPVQHLQYLPFGEHFANEHSSGYDERFTFTGKERDAETGYYYHGARFNSSDIGWLSVDPQFEKLPSITPYNYCLWNPIILHDPNGEIPWILIPIIKGVAGAAIDAAAQVTISMANGQGFSQAVLKIDYTSVLTAGVTSAILKPGASTAVKYGGTILIIIDAAVDADFEGNVESAYGIVGEEKPMQNVAIDLVASKLNGKSVDKFTGDLNKAVNDDLASTAAATLSKEEKNSMRQLQSNVNSDAVQTTLKSATGYAEGGIREAFKSQPNSSISNSPTYYPDRIQPVIHTNDATRVSLPINNTSIY